MTLDTVLLIAAVVCFVAEALRGYVTTLPALNLGWLGLALWALTLLV